MKRLITPIMLLVAMILSFTVDANPITGNRPTSHKVRDIRLRNIKIRPKDASKPEGEVIAYLYENYMSIWFEYPEGMAKVSLSEYGDRNIYRGFSHTSSDIIVNYSVTPGAVIPTRILVETAEGNAYEGWITESVFNDTVD